MALPAPARTLGPAPRSAEPAGDVRPVLPDGTMLWTRERYDQAVNAGVLTSDDKVELLDGLIVAKMPQNTPHRTATLLTGAALRVAFGDTAFVQEEKPVALSDASEPEPDIAVIAGTIRDYAKDHPGPDAYRLIVEVSDSSLLKDRIRKSALYADAGVAEYWIVNLRDRELEVYRDPAGGAYRSKATYAPSASVSPLNAPDSSILVSDLLP